MSNTPFNASQWKKPFILALVLTALAGAAYWLEFKRKPEQVKKEDQSKLVFQIEDKAVKKFSITGVRSQVFVFKCASPESEKLCKPTDNSKWELEAPITASGDESAINSLLSSINTLNINDKIDLKPETPEKRALLLKEYGLDSERRKARDARIVTVETGGTTHRMVLGDIHPMGDTVFALRDENENEVLLLPTYFNTNFEKDLNHWRNKRLFTIASGAITSLELTSPKGKLLLAKADGKWSLNGSMPGDPENIDNLLNAVAFLSAEKILVENKTSPEGRRILASAKPVIRVSVTAEGTPDPIILQLYSRAGRATAADDHDHSAPGHDHSHAGHSHGAPPARKPPTPALLATVSNLDGVFEIEGYARSRLEKTAPELRLTRLISSVERFAVQSIELSGADYKERVKISQKDAKWSITEGAPKDFKLNEERVQAFLDALAAPQIEKFLADAEAPKQGREKGLSVTLNDHNGTAKKQFLFWYEPKQPTLVFAKELSGASGDAFGLKATISPALSWKLEELSKKEEQPSP